VEYESYVYPRYDAPLLDAYGGRYESAFVLLHPFIEVPEALAWKATRQYPSDEQILNHGQKCSWVWVAAQTGLGTCAKVNQALLTSIRSIDDELCDFEAARALASFLQAGSTWMPGEGRFEPLLQMDLLDAFTAAGQEKLVFVPEFPHVDPVQELETARLRSREEPFPSRGSLVAADASFLLTVDWDSFFTLFYGPRDMVTEVVRRRNLEGFFATRTTDHFWFNYSLGCCVVTLSPDGWAAV
jgi:hypothetical protein